MTVLTEFEPTAIALVNGPMIFIHMPPCTDSSGFFCEEEGETRTRAMTNFDGTISGVIPRQTALLWSLQLG